MRVCIFPLLALSLVFAVTAASAEPFDEAGGVAVSSDDQPDAQAPAEAEGDANGEGSGEGDGAGEAEYNTKIKVGDVAPVFEASTIDGSTLKLADYRGKVVLLDFWASWCGPCVAEMPNVIAAYEKFHEKGFEIVGLSLDDDRPALDAFLAEHPGMKWRQVFDGKAWESEPALLYGVDAIPFTLLLDREGNVIAKDLRGEDLAAEIGKQLGE